VPRRPRIPTGTVPGDRFLGYERHELDRQYDLLTRHDDSIATLDGLRRTLAGRARRLPGAERDVPYGAEADMVADLYPAPHPGAPLVVVLQGRNWRNDEGRDGGFVALGLAPAGFAVAVVGHGMVPALTLGAMVERACRALLRLHGDAARLNADPRHMVLLGLGSGAHVAAMTLTADWRRLGVAACPTAGLVAVSGLYDLEPVRLSFLNMGLELDAAAAAQLSPLRLVPILPLPAPHILLAVGERETDEYHRQMATYASALERHGVAVEAATIPGHHHFSLALELANPQSAITNCVIGLIGKAAPAAIDPI